MKIFVKTFIPLFLAPVILTACSSFISAPTTSPTDVMQIATSTVNAEVAETQIASPTTTPISPSPSPASPTSSLFTDPSIPMSEQIVYYYFVTTVENPYPEGSVVIMPNTYVLAPIRSDTTYGSDTATDLWMAVDAALNDRRNGWISSNVEIVGVTFREGHADVVLQGEYFGVGDVTLIAARMQILMTVFANACVQTATVTLNGDTIGNLGISNSMNAKHADYVFTRSEIETFMNENASVSP